MAEAPLRGLASALASQGRYGDTELLHVNRAELDMLDALSPGGLTVNPATGQREAFLPFLIPLLSNALAPTVAGALGLSGTAAALTPAVLSGLGTWAATGDLEQGLLAGVTSGITGGMGGGAEGAAAAAPEAATQAAAQAALAGTISGAPMSAAEASFAGIPTEAAGGGVLDGVMGWVKDNPILALSLASAIPGMMGGGGSGEEARESPPYRQAAPVPRNVVPLSAPGNRPSTYVAGDTSMDDSAYRYGQGPDSVEHMFFDPPPNSSRPILANPEGGSTVRTSFGDFPLSGGGIGDVFSSLFEDGDEDIMDRWRELVMSRSAQRRAMGGPVAQVLPGRPPSTMVRPMPASPMARMTPLPLETPRPPAAPPRPMGLASAGFNARGMMPPHAYASGGKVVGPGTGTSDSVPAIGPGVKPYLLSNGEYILPEWLVTAIGGGSNAAGAAQLDAMRGQPKAAA